MEQAAKDATLILRAAEAQIDAWRAAAARASARSVASGGKPISLSQWVRTRLMDAYKRGE
jgi:hypothetical protein